VLNPRISPISLRMAWQALPADSASANIRVMASRAAILRSDVHRSDISCTTPEWPASTPEPHSTGTTHTSIQREVESGRQTRNIPEYLRPALDDQLSITPFGFSTPRACAHGCRLAPGPGWQIALVAAFM